MEYAPIALFIYNRPGHLQRTLHALAANRGAAKSDLTIFCDGPKSKPEEKHIFDARAVAKSLEFRRCFSSITFVEHERNFGLATSIIDGVSSILANSDRVIVLEDDLVTSPAFLDYANQGLDLYANDQQVMCIHGYAYPIQAQGLLDTYFLLGGDCWGWATWKRAWNCFCPDGQQLLEDLRKRGLDTHFDVDGTYPFTQMLEHQIAGKNNSWAIRWRASTFLRGGLTLYPRQSLVKNIGMDGSGAHCDLTNNYDVELAQSPVCVSRVPLYENSLVFGRLKDYFRKIAQPLAPAPLPPLTWGTRLRRSIWARAKRFRESR